MFTNIPRSSGIYKIVCRTTKKVYIGSAVNLRGRKDYHLYHLRRGDHDNRYLQNAWNKYGEADFDFQVIELILVPFLLEREQYWIDKTRACIRAKGFNLSPTAGSALGVKHSDETCARQSLRRRGHKLSEENKRNLSLAKRKKRWEGFITPDGFSVSIINLKGLCKAQGLCPGKMRAVAAGNAIQHKGWTHVGITRKRGDLTSNYWDDFVRPDGSSVPPFRNLAAFCRENGLSDRHMRLVYLGVRRHHKGWTCSRRLGKCIGSALYDTTNGIVIQPFEGGDVRQRTNSEPEVCLK